MASSYIQYNLCTHFLAHAVGRHLFCHPFLYFLHFYLVSALQLQFAFRAFEQMRYELVGRVTHAAVLLVFVATIIVLQKSVAAIGAGYVLISLTMLIVITIFSPKTRL